MQDTVAYHCSPSCSLAYTHE